MIKADLVEKVHTRTGVAKGKVQEVIEATFAELGEVLASGESYTHTGFGKFSIHSQAERTGRNPRTGEVIKIKSAKIPKFKAGKALKDAVN